MKKRNAMESFVVADDGCWLWTGPINADGYGWCGRQGSAHRVVYRAVVGEIPAGLSLDHLCRVRSCVNPMHLEPVEHRENVLRGEGVAARNALKTHCPQGHPYDEANTYRDPTRGARHCRTCLTVHSRESKRRSRASA